MPEKKQEPVELSLEEEKALLEKTEFPEDEFEDPEQSTEDLGKDQEEDA